ncbi:MAG: hypothetical protein FJW97_08800 [Actinobacteria bacterium]|nr:hypothetical protein [Actinomycetota bacterium]
MTFTATGTAGAATQLVLTTPSVGSASNAVFTTQPVVPPASVANGNALGAVTVDGQVDTTVVLVRVASNSGWEAVGGDLRMMVKTETASGSPEPLGGRGVMQVPQGGRIVVAGDGYMPGTTVSVFALPRASARMVGKMMARSMSGAVLIGSAPVSDSGTVSNSFTVPNGMNVGDYVLQINGETLASQLRSMNLQLNVVSASPTMRAGVIREGGFYQGRSAELSDAGKEKLHSIVKAIPRGAQDVAVVIVGVSVALDSVAANLDLARDRAEGIAKYFEDRGVSGTYTVFVSTTFSVDAAERSLDNGPRASGLQKPVESSSGKPLTTASISFDAPM